MTEEKGGKGREAREGDFKGFAVTMSNCFLRARLEWSERSEKYKIVNKIVTLTTQR